MHELGSDEHFLSLHSFEILDRRSHFCLIPVHLGSIDVSVACLEGTGDRVGGSGGWRSVNPETEVRDLNAAGEGDGRVDVHDGGNDKWGDVIENDDGVDVDLNGGTVVLFCREAIASGGPRRVA